MPRTTRIRVFLAAIACGLAAVTSAHAEVPRVVTDIAPVQSLVARVMQSIGAPDVVLPPGASPHGYALRPSEARALQGAALIVWIGPELTPWLSGPIDTLGGQAEVLALHDSAPVVRSVERNEEHAGHDHAADAAHDHGGEDPHLWLEPSNARAWTAQLAEVLGRIDPENAARYAGNARDAMAELDSVEAEMAARLQPVQGVPFVVFHDSLGYLEDRFGLTSAGSIALSDATAPSARHLSDLRANVASFGARCAFSEPQFDTRLLDALAPGGMRVETLDILGSAQTPGPDLYPAMMRAMAAAMHRCLAP